LGKLTKIFIGHDNSGIGPGWYLESVSIQNTQSGTIWNFPCNRWFARDEDDKSIERELEVNGVPGPHASHYKLTISTGSTRGAGTDANVYISMYGSTGKVENRHLDSEPHSFQRGRVDIFGILTQDIGDITAVRIGHDGKGIGSGWYLDKIFVTNETTNKRWVFPCDRWLAKGEDDHAIERLLTPGDGSRTTYQIQIKTGADFEAGTDANVFLQLFGEKKETPKFELKYSISHTNKFERNNLDVFNLDSEDVGKFTKVLLGHDNTGLGASWFVDYVEIYDQATGECAKFPCGKWLMKTKDEDSLQRELTPAQ